MKKVLYAMILGAMPAIALAAPGDDLADLYFSGKNPTLTKQEKVAIAIAEIGTDADDLVRPQNRPQQIDFG